MPPADAREQLTNRLAAELGPSAAATLVLQLETSGVTPAPVVALLQELEAVSAKIARAAVEALPELYRRAGCSQLMPWLDVGVALAESSGAIALKYFKDSPLILGVIGDSVQQRSVLAVGLELADYDANVSWEYLKASPRIVTVVPAQDLPRWLEIGVELTQSEPVVGLEYIRQIPALAPVLPWEAVRGWVTFAMKLVIPNTFGKPDYLATMEFLRTSPAILGDIEVPLRTHVVSVGTLLASYAPAAGIAWLAESPALLRALPSPPWRLKMLQYGALLAEQDPEAALSYLRRGPELICLLGEESSAFGRFEHWFRTGMEVLSYSPEGARAYFSAESRQALSSVEEALSGVPLKQVARRVKLFVQGLCGSDVSITTRTEAIGERTARAAVSADGKTIMLPPLLRRYPTAEENERLYLIMAAHEAGHLEFGTYRLRIEKLSDLALTLCHRYRRPRPAPLHTLGDLFRLYPQPRLIEDLWAVLEDARVESLLQTHYPGLRSDLARLAAETITARDPAHGLTVRELAVDCLLRLSAGASLPSAVPHALIEEVSILWELCRTVLTADASAEDAVRTADEVYKRLEELVAAAAKAPGEPSKPETSDAAPGPRAADQGAEYRAVENFFFRGEMNADRIAGQTEKQEALQPAGGGGAFAERSGAPTRDRRERQFPGGEPVGGGRSLPSVVEEVLAIDVDAEPMQADDANERIYRYPEWDYRLQDHRIHWCRVIERSAERGSDECVSGILTAHRSTVRLLRRCFE